MRNRFFALLTLSWLMMSMSTASAGVIKELVVFGDSLLDRGNLFAFTTAIPGQPSFPPGIGGYADGRFSNGELWVESLARQRGFRQPTPSLAGGTNYAWGGAETGTSGLSLRNTPNIGAQISGFPGIPGAYPAVPGFLPGNTPMANQLFIIWGGGNDFNNSATLPTLSDARKFAANIAANINTLVAAKATQFMVPNLPRLGQIPRHKGGPNEALFDALTIEFNLALAAELDAIEAASNVNIFRLDTFSLFEEIYADPGKFGFTNTMGSAKIFSDTTDPANFFRPGVVSNPEEYVWFDDVHPTTAMHSILGDQAAALLAVPEPSSIIVWALLGGWIVAMTSLNRRKRSIEATGTLPG